MMSSLAVQLRDYLEELYILAADAGHEKLRLGLGEPHGWPHGYSRYLRWR
jgi:hypothetical protein